MADYSDSHKNAIAKAAGFISSHINSATGVALEVVDGDTEVEWSSSAKLVVVGSDKLQQAAGFRKTTSLLLSGCLTHAHSENNVTATHTKAITCNNLFFMRYTTSK